MRQLKVSWDECLSILEKELGVEKIVLMHIESHESDQEILELPTYILGDLKEGK